MNKFFLGAIPSPEDKRDYVVAAVSATLLDEYNGKYSVPKTKNQTTVGSCVAHSSSSGLELLYGESFSTNFIYSFREDDDYQGVGMVIREALDTLLKHGDPLTEECPGNIEMMAAKEKMFAGCTYEGEWGFGKKKMLIYSDKLKRLLELAAPWKIKEYARVTTEETLQKSLMNGWPVVFCSGITNFYPDASAHIFEPMGNSAGYHAMVVLPKWKTVDKGRVYDVLNSWGDDWGDHGHCWMYVKDILGMSDAWAIVPHDKDDTHTEDIRRTLKLIPKPRMTGEDVKLAQQLLNKHGADLEVDGIFGPATDRAVRAFQEYHSMTVDGVVDLDVWDELEKEPEPAPEPDDFAYELVCFVLTCLGDIYVWGADGETDITEAWIRRMDTKGDPERSIKHWNKQKAAGVTDIAAYDCSGLISRFLEDRGLVNGKCNCDRLYAMCKPISKAELMLGDLVFRTKNNDRYHVGVYVGKGRAVESKGRDDGVILRGIDAEKGYWTHYGRLKV